jgi:hypothetical protein
MAFSYRKPREQIAGLWHFRADCAFWPSVEYIQVSISPGETSERLCEECIRLTSISEIRQQQVVNYPVG